MRIDDMTIGEAKQIAKMVGGQASNTDSFTLGSAIFVQTVLPYYTGELSSVTDADITLRLAAWIPDTGRMSEFLKTGKASEVEPYPTDMPVTISRSAIVSWCPWPHDLPREVK